MAIVPPEFIQEAETAWNSGTSPKTTASFNVKAGDVLVAFATSEEARSISVAGGSLTWTLRQEVSQPNYCRTYVWTAVVDADKAMTVSFTGGGGSQFFGGNVLTFRKSGGVGNSSKTNVSSGAPSLSLTASQEGSALVGAVGDWNAGDGSSRTWRTVNGLTPTAGNGMERTYFRDASRYTVYGAYWSDAGAGGAETVGLSAPSGQKYSIVAVEVKGLEAEEEETAEGTATVSGGGDVSAAGTASRAGAAEVAGGGAVQGSGSKHVTGSASVSGGGEIATASQKGAASLAQVDGGGAVSGGGEKSAEGAGQVTGGGGPVVAASSARSGSATAQGGGEASALGAKGVEDPADVSGGGSVEAVGSKGASNTSVVTGGGGAGSAGSKLAFGAAQVAGGGEVIAQGGSEEEHEAAGSASVSGGGLVGASGFKGALSLASASGGGEVVVSGESGRGQVIVIPGGGAALVIGASWRFGMARVEGGGLVIATGSVPAGVGNVRLEVSAAVANTLTLDAQPATGVALSAIPIASLDLAAGARDRSRPLRNHRDSPRTGGRMICDIDEPVWLRATFTDNETGEPIPPEQLDEIVCTVLVPGTKETKAPEVVDDDPEQGKHKARFSPTTHGKWLYSFDAFDAEGKALARAEGQFEVRKRKVPRD